ncbi:hypothetical protein CDH05_06210 [Pseudomonas lactis]|nr:hypothetical protein CDH05_06210 [Pseudomonas lactis]
MQGRELQLRLIIGAALSVGAAALHAFAILESLESLVNKAQALIFSGQHDGLRFLAVDLHDRAFLHCKMVR